MGGSANPDFPKWSPDGSKIAFLTTSDVAIWCVNRDGSDCHNMRITGNNLQGMPIVLIPANIQQRNTKGMFGPKQSVPE